MLNVGFGCLEKCEVSPTSVDSGPNATFHVWVRERRIDCTVQEFKLGYINVSQKLVRGSE